MPNVCQCFSLLPLRSLFSQAAAPHPVRQKAAHDVKKTLKQHVFVASSTAPGTVAATSLQHELLSHGPEKLFNSMR